MRWIVLLATLVLAGCAGTSSSVRSAYTRGASDRFAYEIDNYGGMTPEGRDILNSRLRQQLASALAVDNDQGANRIKIRINYYRMRHGAARALVGVMAGQDRIQSSVTVTAPDGKVIGSITVDSKNPTALFTARGLIEEHADEIVAFVRTGKSPDAPPPTSAAAPAAPPAPAECKACAKIGSGL